MRSMPDVVPVTDLRQDASGIIKRATASQRPVFITQRGRVAAVVLSAQTCERTQHELEILRLLAKGEAEIEAGGGHALADVMADADELLDKS